MVVLLAWAAIGVARQMIVTNERTARNLWERTLRIALPPCESEAGGFFERILYHFMGKDRGEWGPVIKLVSAVQLTFPENRERIE
jgi:hypothetical protein